ncbi:hypothetical protein SMD44_08338 [Streptomyces alboflavus]|uniref:Uncharacterized protein n=1 Tax=Streptomyces alboflavus TaxID=67267 RepID=A0A1Z1WQX1_9ACTN|nr:hypothetical protein SMD44_08338 [Streptomyces alboflavus]
MSASPTRESSASARSLASARGLRSAETGASVMFSRTVRCGNRLKFWKTKPMRVRWRRTSRSLSSYSLSPRRRVADQLPVDADRAAVQLLQVVDGAQERGLAGAGRADDHGDLTGAHLQVDAAQHLVGAEVLVDAADVHHHGVRAHRFSRWVLRDVRARVA